MDEAHQRALREQATSVLRRAMEIAGGAEPLAVRLGVAPQDLARWIAGSADTPFAVLDRAVEVVVHHLDQDTMAKIDRRDWQRRL
jgi:DNA-binding transcriptional regulator YdaS (Cro superfamily)